jgi:phosphatidylserine decarboxylase
MYSTRIPYWISSLTHFITCLYLPQPLRYLILYLFAKSVKINLKEADHTLSYYTSINQLFTRSLKIRHRPINHDIKTLVSPVDGTLLEYGKIEKGTLLQAKGISYTIDQLIPTQLSSLFNHGHFMCIYLSPSDCHRIFAPYTGECIQTCHVPGTLYPVREPHISTTPGLYTQNERLTSILQTVIGKIAVVMVGAINVGKITVTYNTQFQTNLKTNTTIKTTNHFTPTKLEKGAHLGTFHLGSTVILCIENQRLEFEPFTTNQHLQYGQKIAHLTGV